MQYKIIWTDTAVTEFEEILSYLEDTWNNYIVQDYLDKVEVVFNLIIKSPRTYSRYNNDIHKAIINKRTTLYYKIDEKSKSIYLLSFFGSSQNPSNLKFN